MHTITVFNTSGRKVWDAFTPDTIDPSSESQAIKAAKEIIMVNLWVGSVIVKKDKKKVAEFGTDDI